MTVMPLWRLFADQQNGFVDVGMVGGAQVDRYGNLNSTAIFGDGNYFAPASRLPAAAVPTISPAVRAALSSIPLQRRRFLERVDYITSPVILLAETAGNAPPAKMRSGQAVITGQMHLPVPSGNAGADAGQHPPECNGGGCEKGDSMGAADI